MSINKIKKEKVKSIKEMANNNIASWLDIYCPKGCGCKLRTDNKYIWCSYVHCNYITKNINHRKDWSVK